MKPDVNGKYATKTPKFESLHLPHPEEVTMLLGLPNNFRKMIPLIESLYGVDLELKSSTRAKIFNGGFARRSWNKLVNWLNVLPIPFEKIVTFSLFHKAFKAMRAGSNAGAWLSVVHGMRKSSHDNELTLLLDFIEERASVDYQVLSHYKKSVTKGNIDRADMRANWAHQQALWTQLGLISGEVLIEYANYVEISCTQSDQAEMETEELAFRVLPAVVAMKFDFYLAAIANYEIGLESNGEDVQLESFKGTFSSLIQTYLASDGKGTFFAAMLRELRDSLSCHGKEICWRELASYIAIDESGERAEPLKHKQYKQQKDWRKGKNMPSDAKLRTFVESAIAPLGKYDIEHVLIYFRIAKGIDALVAQYYEQIKDERVLPIISEVLASYPKYFAHYKRLAMAV